MFGIISGLLLILAVETYADFFLQSRDIAKNKSEDPEKLLQHIMILTGAIFIPTAIVFSIGWGSLAGIIGAIFFSVFNGIIHGIIDWNIWKVYKLIVIKRVSKYDDITKFAFLKSFKEEREYAEDPAFYNTIGVDRFLHVATIIILYFWFVG